MLVGPEICQCTPQSAIMATPLSVQGGYWGKGQEAVRIVIPAVAMLLAAVAADQELGWAGGGSGQDRSGSQCLGDQGSWYQALYATSALTDLCQQSS